MPVRPLALVQFRDVTRIDLVENTPEVVARNFFGVGNASGPGRGPPYKGEPVTWHDGFRYETG